MLLFVVLAASLAGCFYVYRRYNVKNPMEGHLGACGRNSYLGVIRPGQGHLVRWHWGQHTNWLKQEAKIPDEPVLVSPGTPLYGICRDGESDGAVWVKGGFLHFVWQDKSQWGTYKYSYDYAPEGVNDNTPLSATGRVGFQAVVWAGDREMMFMHMGGYNKWKPHVVPLYIDLQISPGDIVHAWSRGNDADGIVWAGNGILNCLYHEAEDWEAWKLNIVDADITQATPLAACGRTGFYAIWWASPAGDKIRLLHAGPHTGWDLTYGELEPTVAITPTTQLSALCAEDQFDGVAWEHDGKRHILFEADPSFGAWIYETHPIEGE